MQGSEHLLLLGALRLAIIDFIDYFLQGNGGCCQPRYMPGKSLYLTL